MSSLSRRSCPSTADGDGQPWVETSVYDPDHIDLAQIAAFCRQEYSYSTSTTSHDGWSDGADDTFGG